MKNTVEEQLIALNIIDSSKIEEFYPRVRDRDDIKVLKCGYSGVIYLSSSKHILDSHYHDQKISAYWSVSTREEGLKETSIDDLRRYEQFRGLIKGKTCLDVGSGLGGILDYFKHDAKEVRGIEPQEEIRRFLNLIGHCVYESIECIEDNSVNVLTLFHVFEHTTDPLNSLQKYYNKLTASGKIVIEVPHANDALIKTYNLDSFKKFTFWSEHLILHTRKSLEIFLSKVGFKNIKIFAYQRYSLANHLYWLSAGKPGGQSYLKDFRSQKLDEEYEKLLVEIDQTDTLIAIAEKE
jgi:predicted SAM-dependent methyltransferase